MRFHLIIIAFLWLSCSEKPQETNLEGIKSQEVAIDSIQLATSEDSLSAIDSTHWLVSYVLKKGPAIAPTYASADCVQFMDRLFNPIYKFNIQERNALAIRNTDIRIIRKNIKNNKKTNEAAGIVGVLVNKGLATPVEPKDLQAGDIIQYWYSYELTPLEITPANNIFGHTGIIANNPQGTPDLQMLSSARTNNGFSVRYLSTEWPYQLYACRIKKPF